jgi:hypothetical protein
MYTRLLHHLRRNSVAYLALFLALGGTSYATWLAPANWVNSAAIIDGQVTTPDLASNAVAADENCSVYIGCWGSKEIANGAVASSEIARGAVGNAQLANASVNSEKIVLGSILGNRIAPQAIGNSQLAADAVTGDKVKDGSLTAADIAGGIPQAEAYIARSEGCSSPTAPCEGGLAGDPTIMYLNLPAGYYTLNAETALLNFDDDPQPASCTLSTGAETDVTLPSLLDNGELSVAVEDLLTLTSPGTVSLRCNTFNGAFAHAKLIAIKVAALHG